MVKPASVLLYSHDSQGLGHIKRNLALAHHIGAAAGNGGVRGLIVSGLAASPLFALPRGFDWLTLPGIQKQGGVYVPRHLPGPINETVALREALLGTALESFDPDLVIVDRHPFGIRRELQAPLEALRRRRPDARIVLGLRDVLDEASVVSREWESLGGAEAVAGLVDQVWVYADPAIHDATRTGEIPPPLASRALFIGYLARGRHDVDPHPGRLERPYVLTTAGGGSDGADLIQAALQARVPAGYDHIIVAGPQLDDIEFARACALAGPRTTVVRTCPGLAHRIREAAAVICKGGYNTVCEILATTTPALIVPRRVPRLEQTIRARALTRAHAIDTLPQEQATPQQLSRWLCHAVSRRVQRTHIRLNGLAHAARAATRLLTQTRQGEHS